MIQQDLETTVGQPVWPDRLIHDCMPIAEINPNRVKDRFYRGDARPSPDPLPWAWITPEPYLAPPRLVDAVNMALYLRRPLLLEGEPGTGKTRLARSVAYELGLPLIETFVRSTSRARDLLYTYDAVRRLYDIQERAATAQWRNSATGGEVQQADSGTSFNMANYLKPGELGQAVMLSAMNVPSVVLIDEVDKADIDFPNDLLLVLDQMRFDVDEVSGMSIDALCNGSMAERKPYLPLVLITSNREKELPGPFLRRCLYYFIPFPETAEALRPILKIHMLEEIDQVFTVALKRFWELRKPHEDQFRKKPSTSELIDWVQMLQRGIRRGEFDLDAILKAELGDLPYIGSLLKTQADQELVNATAG